MALLSVEKRKEYFAKLGIAYNKGGIEALQRKYMRKEDVDGKYGTDTDKVLRHVYNVLIWLPSNNGGKSNFMPEEFKCECGGKYCTGYPSYMKRVELQNLQSIRTHYGKPMTITCGLRCKTYNKQCRGSIENSKHLTGYAADFYIAGVTETLAQRKKAIAWIKKLPNHNYTYGNGYNSKGAKISAGYMGNALHTDTNKPEATVKLAAATPKKVTQYLTQAELKVWFNALKKQVNNAKNSKYVWVEKPTYANSRKKCTCIALHSVALQLIGLLPKGGYFYYHPTKKRISGNRASYVKKHKELFKLSYPNKKMKTLIKQGKLQAGDIVGFGNPSYHSMVYLGQKNGHPIFATLGHKKSYGVRYKAYENRKVNMIVRLKKVKR